MNGVARAFFLVAIVAGLCGMVWGIQMSASQDHTLSPAHGHLNLLGWVSCSIFAFYYHLVPSSAANPLARLHFGLVVVAVVLLAPGVALAIQGKTELLAKLGSVIMLGSMLLFGWIVLKVPGRVTATA